MSRYVLLLALALAVVPVGATAASGTRAWGYDAEELAARLARGEHEPLRHVDFSRHRISDIVRLGDDAPYALGLIYLELGIPEIAERLLRLAFDEAPEPWRGAAFTELVHLLRDAERYAELEDLVRGRDDLQSRVALAESLYGRQRFVDLAGELESLLPLIASAYSPSDPRALEAALWHAVTLIELDRPGWANAVRALYRDYPAAEVHSRVWVYLINRDGLLDAFSDEEIDFFRAKQLSGEGRTAQAIEILVRLAPERPAPMRSPQGLLDLYLAGAASRRFGPAAEALIAAAGDGPPQTVRLAAEYAGRLYRLAGAYAAALPLFERSLSLQDSDAGRRRLQWYLLSTRVRRDPVATASSLAGIVASLSEPAYFDDVLVELAGLLAERERWDLLREAYESIEGFATPGARARYEIALAGAVGAGRLEDGSARAAELRQRSLERAYEQRENVFAALVAAALLDRDGVEILGLQDVEREGDAAADAGSTHETVLADTYLRYSLLDRLFGTVRSGGAAIDPAVRLSAAVRLARAGRFRESILAMSALERTGGALTSEAAELRYPLAFAAIVECRVAAEGVDPAVFYALIREESLFDPEIASVAGAVGLAQLIPSTAADIAGRMGLADPVLSDPADNLAIGARYFSMLTEQFGTPARALAAYNAGQGNVRRWERRSPALDELLFHQAIPFPETYNHVRKVVVSAAYYGYLYAGRAPGETVRLIFGLD